MSFSSLKLQQQINCSCNVFINNDNIEINFVLYNFFILFDNDITRFNYNNNDINNKLYNIDLFNWNYFLYIFQ